MSKLRLYNEEIKQEERIIIWNWRKEFEKYGITIKHPFTNKEDAKANNAVFPVRISSGFVTKETNYIDDYLDIEKDSNNTIISAKIKDGYFTGYYVNNNNFLNNYLKTFTQDKWAYSPYSPIDLAYYGSKIIHTEDNSEMDLCFNCFQREEERLLFLAAILFMLPLRVLISPLWHRNLKGCASGQLGKVFVLYLW